MGKTWLLSQVIVHALDATGNALLPLLIKADQLRDRLTKDAAAFAAASNWVGAYLQATCEGKEHPAMLQRALTERRALLLLDGLDEAGADRGRLEAHIAEVLVPQGHVILCTSRPAGLSEGLFARFHRL